MLTLPHYTLPQRISQSASTALYRGHRDDDGLRVLAKVLTEEHPSPSELARLRHEFALEKELALDGIIQPVALVERGHGLVLLWNDPAGVPLRMRLAAGPLTLAQALNMAAKTARILERIHRHHIIHRDICPENILVDADAHMVALSGLGIASRLSQESQPISGPCALEGNPTYVSPEQTGRMNRRTDPRSDLYSLGVVLYELLTGTPPFSSQDVMALVYSHLAERPVPPHELVPALPRIVSDLVMRLLEKNAEDRYQYAGGVASDLEECLARLAQGAVIPPFSLGKSDSGGALHLPQKLYGRQAEQQALYAAWERASTGTAELLLVRGYSGIGKSSLVHELHKALTGAHGFFVSGKFDQLNRSVPYAPLAAAFRDLCRQLLMEPSSSLDLFREQIQSGLGTTGQVLVDLIPDLTMIMGPQPSVPQMEGAAARSRLMRSVQRFLHVFSALERPLVLFLDDLQWVDLASLELLVSLLQEGESKHLLIIGAYRSNEVDGAHPLTMAMRELSARAKVHTIELGPLDRTDVGRFVADALDILPERAAPLGSLLFDKTLGNPFFLIQLMTALHRDGVLGYDQSTHGYHWDLESVRQAAATDNVIEFLTSRIDRLQRQTQRVLSLASCIGHRFDLQTLSTICEDSPLQSAAALWEALAEGIIVPQSSDYRYVHSASLSEGATTKVVYRFLHDRVQQAAYARVEPKDRAALHLKIGRLLQHRTHHCEGDELFELVAHLNIGRDLLTDPDERRELAQLDLQAGRQAKAAAAHESAYQILSAGVSVLTPLSFRSDHELAFALHRELAECAMLARAHGQAEQTITTLLAQSQTTLELLQASDLRVVLDASLGRPDAAVKAGLGALRRSGIAVADTEQELRADYARALDEVRSHMSERTLDELASAPSMASPEMRAVLRLGRHVALSAFGNTPLLGNVLTALAANLSFRHGPSEESAAAYALLGAVLASSTERFAEAHALVKLALSLHAKRGGVQEACMLGFYFTTVSHYSMHWRELLPYLERAYVAGLESGDMMFLSYTCSHRSIARILLGDPISEVRQDCLRMLALLEKHKLAAAAATQSIVRQTIACLEQRTRSPRTLDDDQWTEAEFVRTIENANMSFAIYFYNMAKGMLLFLDENPEGALPFLRRTAAMASIAFTPDARFFTALSILGCSQPESAEDAGARAQLLDQCLTQLATWARACPANYLHKYRLVLAEKARRDGNHSEAMERYDQAISAAQESDWPRDLALASELCAKFYLALGRQRIARAYMTDACYAYARWGALAQVRRLTERYPFLIPVEATAPEYKALPAEGTLAAIDQADLLAFVTALQMLSREFVIENVVDRILRIVVQNAGAERGFLILARPDDAKTYEIYASFQDASVQTRVGAGIPLEESTELALTVVRYVTRTSESVVLDDACRDERFAGDPYIVRQLPRSIACISLANQGRPKGVLYLENNVAYGAFTPQRIDLLRMLSSQAAVSIENAELYARVHRVTAALEKANAELESDVAKRTRELREANERLTIELTERQRNQELQASLQAEVIRMQSERLAELSTPVIPIMPGILLMSLHGSMDGQRASQILEAALDGAQQQRAHIVLMDITATVSEDTALAGVLVQTSRALRLLGAKAIVTGIGAKMAQAMIARGVDLDELTTAATLAGGMMIALEGTGNGFRNREVRPLGKR